MFFLCCTYSCLLQSAQDVLEARCDLLASEMMMTRNVSGGTQVLNELVSSNIHGCFSRVFINDDLFFVLYGLKE